MMTSRWCWQPWRSQILLLVVWIALRSSVSMGETCCADCLDQTDPLNSVITYDPLVFDQCSAATGICCYGCVFSHGTLQYQDGITFNANGTAEAATGLPFSFSFNDVFRVTYDFLKPNQTQTSFVRNESIEASFVGDVFTICADNPGTIALRGWGTDACTQVTDEYKINVVEGSATGKCDSVILVGSTSSASNEPVDATGGNATRSSYSDASDYVSCNPTRGTLVTQADGSKVCKCTGDWRNPPTCDEFSYVKVIITILGAVATVISILFSVGAYIKSRREKEAKNGTTQEGSDDDDDDILSVEVIHIGSKPPLDTPGSRSKPSPSSTTRSTPVSPAHPSFIASEELHTTTMKETTL